MSPLSAKALPEEPTLLLRTVQVNMLDTSEPRNRAQALLSKSIFQG